MEQRTPEWFALRLGKVTASRVADVIAKTKSGPSALRANYEAQLIAERLTGQQQDSFTNAAMQWGTDTEPQAIAAYSFMHDAEVSPIGFIGHPTIAESGASPDGLVGGDGLVEVKCPNTATHIATLLGEKVPAKYVTQMQWQMACLPARQWCDFVSFDPRMPADLQLFVQRVERDDDMIAELEREVTIFLSQLADKVRRLERLNSNPTILGDVPVDDFPGDRVRA